jgi:predicted secreted protein
VTPCNTGDTYTRLSTSQPPTASQTLTSSQNTNQIARPPATHHLRRLRRGKLRHTVLQGLYLPDPYFAPSEKARKEGARTIYDVAGQQYHTVLVAAIPAGNRPSLVESNVAGKPDAAAPASANTNRNYSRSTVLAGGVFKYFNLDSNPL